MSLSLFMTKTKEAPLPLRNIIWIKQKGQWTGSGRRGRGGGGRKYQEDNRSKWWLWIPHNWNIPLSSILFHSNVRSSLSPALPAPTLWRGFYFIAQIPCKFQRQEFHSHLPHLPACKEDSPLVLLHQTWAGEKDRVLISLFFFVLIWFFSFCVCLTGHHKELCPLFPHSSSPPSTPLFPQGWPAHNLYISCIFLLGVYSSWKTKKGRRKFDIFSLLYTLKLPLPGKFLSQNERGICTELVPIFAQCPLPTQTSRPWIYSSCWVFSLSGKNSTFPWYGWPGTPTPLWFPRTVFICFPKQKYVCILIEFIFKMCISSLSRILRNSE